MTATRVVTMCGSMRFEQQMREAAVTESLAGAIVLLPLVNMAQPDARWADPVDAARVKTGLDELHLAKIDLATEVLVVCPGGYIGASTGREIDYARAAGTPVRFWPQQPESVPCGFECGYLADSESDLIHHEAQCENADGWGPVTGPVTGAACIMPAGHDNGIHDRGAPPARPVTSLRQGNRHGRAR